MTFPRQRPAEARSAASWRPRAKTVAGFIVLLTSIACFLLQGVSDVLFHQHIDLDKPAWAFLVLSGYTLFGVSLPSLMAGRNAEKAGADESD